MKFLTRFAALLSLILMPVSNLLAQSSSSDDQAAAAGCLACGGIGLFLIIGGIILNIVLLVWVARDAKARGMDSSVLWMLLVFFTGVLGLIIYLFSRPKGNLIPCAQCGNKRMAAAAKCPTCGNS